jgi:CO/xanthine dehydrogenase FAD-binding subunit
LIFDIETMIPSFDYRNPKTLREARDLLWDYREEAKIIAGGTDLVIGLRRGDLKPRCLIDITGIEEIRRIEEKDGVVAIGAGASHFELASSALIRRFGGALSEAASSVGSPQIRNLGTVGGNIVNASPAADTVPPLVVLNATGKVVSKEGEREVALDQLFNGPYESSLKSYEILVQVKFPKLSSSAKSGFIRLARRDAMAIARMSVAVVLHKEKGCIRDLRISVGSVTPRPQRMSDAETVLEGKVPEEEGLRLAAQQISETMVRQSGVRPTTSYKRPVVEALFIRAMRKALEG